VAVALPLAAQTPPSPPAPAKRTVELTGLVLVNGFFTNARVNNSDLPQFADSLPSASAIGGTIRQTRLGVLVTDPDVLRGSFSGEVDVDFYGGQQPSSGGRTFPLLRLRRAVGIVSWPHAQLLFGQESPLVAERSPRSLASVGTPDFATAGHLGWLASADTLFQSRAVTADARVKAGPVELLAEAFSGKALAGLGGGGIGQSLGPTGKEVRTKGGWGQLNVRPRREVIVGGGCGIDDPDDGDLSDALGSPRGRLKNFVCEGHVDLRPRGPLLFGIEFRRLETTYPSGKFTANHFNLAAGYRF